jgi:hypothetical protein
MGAEAPHARGLAMNEGNGKELKGRGRHLEHWIAILTLWLLACQIKVLSPTIAQRYSQLREAVVENITDTILTNLIAHGFQMANVEHAFKFLLLLLP